MWWEVLPSMAVMGAALAFPEIFNYTTNLIFRGTPHVRRAVTSDEIIHYYRDRRLNGLKYPYVQIGLDNLEDYCAPPPQPEEECTCPPKPNESNEKV